MNGNNLILPLSETAQNWPSAGKVIMKDRVSFYDPIRAQHSD